MQRAPFSNNRRPHRLQLALNRQYRPSKSGAFSMLQISNVFAVEYDDLSFYSGKDYCRQAADYFICHVAD